MTGKVDPNNKLETNMDIFEGEPQKVSEDDPQIQEVQNDQKFLSQVTQPQATPPQDDNANCQSSENETDFESSDEEEKVAKLEEEFKTPKEDIIYKERTFIKDCKEEYDQYVTERNKFTKINSQFEYDIRRFASNDNTDIMKKNDPK